MERLKRQVSFGLPEKKSADNCAASLIRGLFGATFVELGAYHGSRDADGKPVLCNTITGYGAVLKALVNKDLTWEKTDKLSVGIETKKFHDRLTLDFEYY